MFSVKLATDQITLNQIIDLRYTILRKPWGKALETAADDLEDSSINAYVEFENKIVACGRLQNNGKGIAQIRYMAVDANYQGKGLGKAILIKLEEEARKIGIHTIELHARENAVLFYQSQQYVMIEKSYNLWDIIQHYLMMKKL